MVVLKEFFEKVDFEKSQQTTKKKNIHYAKRQGFYCMDIKHFAPPKNMLFLRNWTKPIDVSNVVNSLPACNNFCRLLITFANNLDPDQARQHVRPDLDPNCLTI